MLIRKSNESTKVQNLYNVAKSRYIIIGTTEAGRIKYVRFYEEEEDGYGALIAAYHPTRILYLEQVTCEVEDDGENYFALDTDMLSYMEDYFEAVYEA